MTQKPLRDIDSLARMDRLRMIFWLGPAGFV
jgi:hypothetical protein